MSDSRALKQAWCDYVILVELCTLRKLKRCDLVGRAYCQLHSLPTEVSEIDVPILQMIDRADFQSLLIYLLIGSRVSDAVIYADIVPVHELTIIKFHYSNNTVVCFAQRGIYLHKLGHQQRMLK